MSGSMYVGQLCATQIAGRIDLEDRDLTKDSAYLVTVIHGGRSRYTGEPYPTVRLVIRDPNSHQQRPVDLPPSHVVRCDDPTEAVAS